MKAGRTLGALLLAVTACREPAAVHPPPARTPPPGADWGSAAAAPSPCPGQTEDPDGIADEDGCPETDADGDGVLDEVDACPELMGSELTARLGCPWLPPTDEPCARAEASPTIEYAPEAAALPESARGRLASVAREVTGLGDGFVLTVVGQRAQLEPVDLGLERAEVVRATLVDLGVVRERTRVVNRGVAGAPSVTLRLERRCSVPPSAGDYAFQDPLPPRALPPDAPARRYANLTPAACAAEIARRALPVSRERRPTPGVALGVRFAGPVNGVTIVAPGAPTEFGVLDCRLALVLDDATRFLAERGVVRLRLDNTYRRGARLPADRGKRSQHAYGLAADITALTLADGRTLDVERDWHTPLGAAPCGPDADLDEPTEAAITLHDLACELGRRGLFHTMLTPSYDVAHRNHFHFDVKRDSTTWAIH